MTRNKLVSVMGTGTRLIKIGQVETGLNGGTKADTRKPKKGIGSIKYTDNDCFIFNEKTQSWDNPKHSKEVFKQQSDLNDSLKAFEQNKD